MGSFSIAFLHADDRSDERSIGTAQAAPGADLEPFSGRCRPTLRPLTPGDLRKRTGQMRERRRNGTPGLQQARDGGQAALKALLAGVLERIELDPAAARVPASLPY
jgi:hypothetical protein